MNHQELNILKWLENWYKSYCNGNWEHSYGVKIDNLDNPGWQIQIDLKDTKLEDLEVKTKLVDNADNDWFVYKIENSIYDACGDPSKLEFLLKKFKEIVEKHENI